MFAAVLAAVEVPAGLFFGEGFEDSIASDQVIDYHRLSNQGQGDPAFRKAERAAPIMHFSVYSNSN